MKYSEINKRYTEIVAEYMNKGYTINTASMSGSQGEIAKIDLTDGTEIIRIVISTFVKYNDLHSEGIEIIVGRTTDKAKPHSNNKDYTVWNNHLEIICEERFYQIGSYGTDFYGNEEEAKRASQIKHERWALRREDNSRTELKNEKAIEIAKNIIRTKFGYNRINTPEIKITKCKFEDRIGYIVRYRNNTYKLK